MLFGLIKRNSNRNTAPAPGTPGFAAIEERSSRDWMLGRDGVVFINNIGSAKSGVQVTPETALQASAVLGCVGRIARDLSTLPLHLLDAQGSRVKNHPVAKLLLNPSPYHVPATVWQSYILNLLTWGYGCAVIEFKGDGVTPSAVIPLMSKHVTPQRVKGEVLYRVDGYASLLRAEDVLHTPYLAFDGIAGQSPIRLARDVIGTSMALDEFAARFFSNGANSGTFIELPKMSRDALAEMQKLVRDSYTGLDHAHKPMAIPEAKPHKVGVSPRESQAIEARDFQLREIARVFSVPIGIIDPEKSKYAGLEAQYRDYAQTTLRPIAVMIEQELERKLLAESEKGELSIRWNLDAMVRASLADRTAADTALVTAGIQTPNEARDHHNLAPLPGGDQLFSPLNMAPTAKRSRLPRPRKERSITAVIDEPAGPQADPRVELLLRSIADGVATKEANAARNAARKPDQFADWAESWFSEHRSHLKARLPNVDEATAEYLAVEARDLLLKAHAEGTLDALLEGWNLSRPQAITRLALAA